MTRSITKLFLGGAAVATLALTGCSAGMISQTADQVAPVPGASMNLDAPVDAAKNEAPGSNGSVSVRDVAILYSGPAGFKAGANAPLQARIFNDTAGPVTFTVTVDPAVAESVTLVGGKASAAPSPTSSPSAPAPSASASAQPSGSAKPSASVSASPSAPAPSAPAAATPVKLTIPSGGYLALDPTVGQYLQINGLKKPLNNATAVPLVFKFTFGSQTLDMAPVLAPVAPPLDEHAPRVPGVVESKPAEGH